MTIAHHPEGRRIPPSTLGSRLRDARTWRRLEQAQLAEALDVSRATISNYENGVSKPSKLQVAAWAVVTDTDVDWLRTGHTETAPTPKGGGRGLPEMDSNHQPAGVKPGADARSNVIALTSRKHAEVVPFKRDAA